MKVQIVMGLSQGVLSHLFVTTSERLAQETVKRIDKELGIERDETGHYEHDENDCWSREATVWEDNSKQTTHRMQAGKDQKPARGKSRR